MKKLQSIECGGVLNFFLKWNKSRVYQEIFWTHRRSQFYPLHGLSVSIMEEVEFIIVHNYSPRVFYIRREVMQLNNRKDLIWHLIVCRMEEIILRFS